MGGYDAPVFEHMRFPRTLQLWALILFGPLALTWLIMAAIYAVTPTYIDHVEPSMVVAAQQWLHGFPLYHPGDSPYLYSFLLGPFDYLWLAWTLTLSPDPVLASKLSGGFWSLSSLFLLLVIFWRSGGLVIALASVGLVGGELMLDLVAPFWDRPDPILVFSASLGLSTLKLKDQRLGAGILVLAIAMAIACKIHGLLYLLPTLAIWYRRHGWHWCAGILCAALPLAFAPFLLPGVSLENYFFWLRMGAQQPRMWDILGENAETLVQLVFPVIFFVGHPRLKLQWREATEETILLYAVLVAGLLVCIPASKAGAGWHHLLPLTVYVGYLFCLLLASSTGPLKFRWVTAAVVVWAFFTYNRVVHNCSYVIWSLENIPAQLVQDDLRQILQVYPVAETQMGVGRGGGYIFTFYSPWLYREGTPCVINVGAFMDMKEAGLTASALKTSLETEQFRYWLIPRDGPPFTMNSWYDSLPLFDYSLAQTFSQHYVRVNSTPFFDIYQARTVVR